MGTVRIALVVAVLAGCAVFAESVAAATPVITTVYTDVPIASGAYVAPAVVMCPAGTVVWGGGADGSTAVGTGLAGIFPSGSTSWVTKMNNASAYPNVFGADAQCGAKPSGYKQVKKTVTNPAGAQTGASVTCPTGTVVLSGGVATSADSPGSWVTAMIPASSTKFHGANYNGTGASENFSVIAICAKKPPGYVIVGGSSTFSGPGTFAPNEICPSGTTGLFAGVSTNSTNPIEIPIVDSNNYDLLAFVNATYPGSITIQHKGICVS